MAIQLDLNSLKVRDVKLLCRELGFTDIRQLQTLGERIPPEMLAPVAYIFRRQSDPTFTLEQAEDMSFAELMGVFNAETPAPNGDGGQTANPMTTSSDPSVRSTTTRRNNSTRSQ